MTDFVNPISTRGLATDSSNLIESLQQEYARADAFCREVQEFRREAGIPAINELRYVSHHLLKAIAADGSVIDAEQVQRAVRHAQRATYEAAEAGISLALREIKLFKNDYKRVTVGDVVKDWLDILGRCKTIRQTLNAARETGDDRTLDHIRHLEAFRELVSILDRLDTAREELNKKMAAENRLSFRFVVATCIAMVGILVAIIVALTR